MTTPTGTVISYPIPAYSNPPIEPQFYQPNRFVISDITLGSTTIITATEDMNYVVGQEVRLLIPGSFGCYQLNEVSGFVLSLPDDDQVELNINSINMDKFVSSTATTVAQIIAIGDINSGIQSSTGRIIPTTNIPGSFINISPQ